MEGGCSLNSVLATLIPGASVSVLSLIGSLSEDCEGMSAPQIRQRSPEQPHPLGMTLTHWIRNICVSFKKQDMESRTGWISCFPRTPGKFETMAVTLTSVSLQACLSGHPRF